MELEPWNLVSRNLKLSFISYIFCIKKYAVDLPHEATENLKWELGNRFALKENYSIFYMFFWCFAPNMYFKIK